MLLRDELELDDDGFGDEEGDGNQAEEDVEMRKDNREIRDDNNA